MSSWAERVHRRAADFGITSCGHPGTGTTYPYRLEKVKFGVPLEEVCKSNDNIPGPLLVLILKLNKESPNRRDVFRAPGHQGAMKKLIHFLQAGRLVNVDNYSVYTIASVLKKFLRKIPSGIFGRTGENELFAINELENEAEQTERLHRLLTSLPKYTQHLLVLLFGTFRVIASNAAHAGTGMTSEALGVSVAPSFFQSCVSDGKTARMEDVLKFKVATRIMKHIIDKFATQDLFGRENYEYYARVTGRILKVQDEWICSFQYPPPPRGKLAQQKYALQHSLEAEKTWLQCQCERWGLLAQEESRSTPALLTSSSSALDNSVLSLGVTPEHSFIESCARLSVSLEGPGLFALTSSPIPKRGNDERADVLDDYDDDDENIVADDEDDDDDDEEHDPELEDDDFVAELEISNDDDIENNPIHSVHNKCIRYNTSRSPPKGGSSDGGGSISVVGSGGGVSHDDDDDEVTVVKRRYRQNKKKLTTQTTRTQHQRRLRSGASKSLDHAQMSSENLSPPPLGPKPTLAVAGAAASCSASNGGGVGGSSAAAAVLTRISAKTRTCSRCNRGIRHSSSCSSASGGGNGGGHMTMDELRAVNRYAESTKSLSYLPQVHERQTARMRTRSEWFLGPKDAISSLQLQTTCSNCCLVTQQQQQQQHHDASYLGGGSTSNMLQQDPASSAMYLLYKKRQKQQHQYFQAEHMDTDESIDYDHQQQQHQQQLHSTFLHCHGGGVGASFMPSAAAAASKTSTATASSAAAAAASISGSYVDSCSTNNFSYHDNNYYINNYNNNNNNSNNNIHYYNIKENNNEYQQQQHYDFDNEQEIVKEDEQQQHKSQQQNYDLSSYHHPLRRRRQKVQPLQPHNEKLKYIPHDYKPQNRRLTKAHKNHAHYCSSDSIRFCADGADSVLAEKNDGAEILANPQTSSKLYRSPRKQSVGSHEEVLGCISNKRPNPAIPLSPLQHKIDGSVMLRSDVTVRSTTPSSSISYISQPTPVSQAGRTTQEEVDFILTSRFRHSTPMSQRRRLNARQQLPSSSSARTMYQQSTNSSTRSGSGVSGTGSNSGNIGNIRLSNSAESIQYPVRRSSRRGLGLPGQYPLRSSLRRNKEKGSNNSNSNGNNSNSNSCDSSILAAAAAVVSVSVSGGNQSPRNSKSNRPPSVRNSIAECCSNISSNQQYLAMNSNILTSFPFNRVQSRTVSFENRQQLKSYMDADEDTSIGADNTMDTSDGSSAQCKATNSTITTTKIADMLPMPSTVVAAEAINAKLISKQSTTTSVTATATSTSLKPPRV